MWKHGRTLILALGVLALAIGAVLYVGSLDPTPDLPGPGLAQGEQGEQDVEPGVVGVQAKGCAVEVVELRTCSDGSFAWGMSKPEGAVTLRFSAPSPDVLMFRNTEVVRAGSPPPQDLVLRAYLVDATVTGTSVTRRASRSRAPTWSTGATTNPSL